MTILGLGLALSAAAAAGQGDAPLQVPADALEDPGEIGIRAVCVIAVNMMADLRGDDPC